MKQKESISFQEFMLEVKRENGWKKPVYHRRKTTHPNMIKLIVNSVSK